MQKIRDKDHQHQHQHQHQHRHRHRFNIDSTNCLNLLFKGIVAFVSFLGNIFVDIAFAIWHTFYGYDSHSKNRYL